MVLSERARSIYLQQILWTVDREHTCSEWAVILLGRVWELNEEGYLWTLARVSQRRHSSFFVIDIHQNMPLGLILTPFDHFQILICELSPEWACGDTAGHFARHSNPFLRHYIRSEWCWWGSYQKGSSGNYYLLGFCLLSIVYPLHPDCKRVVFGIACLVFDQGGRGWLIFGERTESQSHFCDKNGQFLVVIMLVLL